MPSPKSGKAICAVAPAAPKYAYEADLADPGEAWKMRTAQCEQKQGKYGTVPTTPYRPPQTEEEQQERPSWIEIELKDRKGRPVPGEPYLVTLPDGTTTDGTLNEKGFIRIDGIKPGTCKITFPKLDKKTWGRN